MVDHKVRSILIVDDDPDIRRLVGDFLTREGFRVDRAQDARPLFAEGEQRVLLTSAEFDLLSCFVLRRRRVLSRDQIVDWMHGRTADPFDRSVDILVSRLRKNLDALSPGCNLISTVRNGGYLMTAQVKQVS